MRRRLPIHCEVIGMRMWLSSVHPVLRASQSSCSTLIRFGSVLLVAVANVFM